MKEKGRTKCCNPRTWLTSSPCLLPNQRSLLQAKFYSGPLKSHERLFLEQIFEGLSGVCGARRCRSGSLFFDSNAYRIVRAGVELVLAGNPLRYFLRALEACCGIKICALLAGVQFKPALRALSNWVVQRRQHGSTLPAPRDRVRAGKLQGPW